MALQSVVGQLCRYSTAKFRSVLNFTLVGSIRFWRQEGYLVFKTITQVRRQSIKPPQHRHAAGSTDRKVVKSRSSSDTKDCRTSGRRNYIPHPQCNHRQAGTCSQQYNMKQHTFMLFAWMRSRLDLGHDSTSSASRGTASRGTDFKLRFEKHHIHH